MDFDNKISLFRNYFNPDPVHEITMREFIRYIMEATEHQDKFKELRDPGTTTERKKEIKSRLPAVTISGTFSKRERGALLKHSGFICLDFDSKLNPGVTYWPAFREDLKEINNIAFCALSASGKGCFAIIPLEHPDRHFDQFKALQLDFKYMSNVPDPACSDVTRLRGISYDPEAWINENAIPYRKIYTPAPPPQYHYDKNDDDLEKLIEMIVNLRVDLTNSYQAWFEIGSALANEYGEAGRGYFHQLSQFHPKYKPAETDKQYDNCLRYKCRITKATIFYYAKMAGIKLKNA